MADSPDIWKKFRNPSNDENGPVKVDYTRADNLLKVQWSSAQREITSTLHDGENHLQLIHRFKIAGSQYGQVIGFYLHQVGDIPEASVENCFAVDSQIPICTFHQRLNALVVQWHEGLVIPDDRWRTKFGLVLARSVEPTDHPDGPEPDLHDMPVGGVAVLGFTDLL